MADTLLADRLEELSIKLILYVAESADIDFAPILDKLIEIVPPHLHTSLKYAVSAAGQGADSLVSSMEAEGEDTSFIERPIADLLDEGFEVDDVRFDDLFKCMNTVHTKISNQLKLIQSAEDIGSGDPVREMIGYERLSGIDVPNAADTVTVDRVSLSDITEEQAEKWSDDCVRDRTHTPFDQWMILAGGELGIVFGPPNVGKTSALVAMGTGWVQNHNKLYIHISLEPRQPQMVVKYASCLLQDPTVCIDDFHSDRFRKKLASKMNGQLIVECHNDIKVSPDDLTRFIERIIEEEPSAQGLELGGILLDYLTLMKLRGDNKVNALADNVIDTRVMANHFNTPVWTGAQSQRSPSKDIRISTQLNNNVLPVLTMEDIGECWAYSQVADYIISMNQTAEEKVESVVRNHLCKTREPRKGADMKKLTSKHQFNYGTCTII